MKIHKVRPPEIGGESATGNASAGAVAGTSTRPVAPMPPQTSPPEQSTSSITVDVDPVADARASDGEETGGAPKEIGGPKGPEPTRYGDWERKGRCVDF